MIRKKIQASHHHHAQVPDTVKQDAQKKDKVPLYSKETGKPYQYSGNQYHMHPAVEPWEQAEQIDDCINKEDEERIILKSPFFLYSGHKGAEKDSHKDGVQDAFGACEQLKKQSKVCLVQLTLSLLQFVNLSEKCATGKCFCIGRCCDSDLKTVGYNFAISSLVTGNVK